MATRNILKGEGLFYSGELTKIRGIKRAEKALKKNRIVFEFEDDVFTIYSELFDREYYKELTIYLEQEDGEKYWILSNGDYSTQYYCAEYNDVQEMIDYIFRNFTSKFRRNGQILTR